MMNEMIHKKQERKEKNYQPVTLNVVEMNKKPYLMLFFLIKTRQKKIPKRNRKLFFLYSKEKLN